MIPHFLNGSRVAHGLRLFPWLVVPLLLLLMGFHAASDPLLLAGDNVLSLADYAGYAVCHRLTEHSVLLAGRQMPLCARCTGMYLGVALSAVLVVGSGRWRHTGFAPWPVLALLLIFVVLMGIDGLNSYAHFFAGAPHLYEPQNWLRLSTGMGTGIGMGFVALPALAETMWSRVARKDVIASFGEMSGVVVLGVIVILLVLSNFEPIVYVLSVVSAAGVLFILSVLNTIGLLVVTRREGQVMTAKQAVWPLLAGLGLALLQIVVIGLIRFRLTGTLTGFPGL